MRKGMRQENNERKAAAGGCVLRVWRKTLRKPLRKTLGLTAAGLVSAALLLSGCGSSSGSYRADQAMAVDYADYAEETAQDAGYEDNSLFRSAASSQQAAGAAEASGGEGAEEAGTEESDGASETGAGEVPEEETEQSDRKLITTVDLSVQTREFEKLQKDLEETVTALGGYIESSTVYNSNYWSNYDTAEEDTFGDRSASYTLRIPEKRLDEFLEKLHDGANVTRESRSVEDITLEYVDVASHKRALETEAKSLEKMLEQATELSDIIQIQSELTDVRYQIDSIESRLRTYDNQVDYSTVNLNVDEVRIYTQPANASVWTKISTGFLKSLKDVGNGIVDAAVWIVIHIPQLLVTAAVLAVAVWLVKKLRKAGRNRKEKKRAKKQKDGVFRQEPQNISQPTPQNADRLAQPEENEKKQ